VQAWFGSLRYRRTTAWHPRQFGFVPPPTLGFGGQAVAILTLLGGAAGLLTAALGYLQARDALQESICNQLTATRKSKARQVETYFRTIRNELRPACHRENDNRRGAGVPDWVGRA
jgi:hypothetical protein